jgi:hypothetical protein
MGELHVAILPDSVSMRLSTDGGACRSVVSSGHSRLRLRSAVEMAVAPPANRLRTRCSRGRQP